MVQWAGFVLCGAGLLVCAQQKRVLLPIHPLSPTQPHPTPPKPPSDALPGYGWLASGNVPGRIAQCPVGTFNANRVPPPVAPVTGGLPFGCRPCSGGLTTVLNGSSTSNDCMAPPGFYNVLGKAIPCPVGKFKDTIGNDDLCTPCPEGWSTALPGAPSVDLCRRELGLGEAAGRHFFGAAEAAALLSPRPTRRPRSPHHAPKVRLSLSTLKHAGVDPGYEVDLSGELAFCPLNTYNGGGQIWAPGTTINCTACPLGMGTDYEGARTITECLVMPGYGLDPELNTTAILCPNGTYNEGWNRNQCQRCGENIATLTTGSTSSEQCIIPPGHGAGPANEREWVAFPCPPDTYGSPDVTQGLVRQDCIGCIDRMTTFNVTGSTSEAACLTRPGMGYYQNAVRLCLDGEWSAGGSRKPCSSCGNGYTTAEVGSTSAAACLLAEGWTPDGVGGAKPCARGMYKDALGPSACTACPSGTSTVDYGSTWLGDCGICKAGYGADAIDATAPSCELCAPGTYSAGGGMQACLGCDATMVSKVVSASCARVAVADCGGGGGGLRSNRFADYAARAS